MRLTADQAPAHQSILPAHERRSTSGVIDKFARESALEGQLSTARANGREEVNWPDCVIGQNRSARSSIQFETRSSNNTETSLRAHISKGRTALAELRKAEQQAEQKKTHQQALAWLAKNRDIYAGQWIALQGGELLANGKDARDVYTRVRGQQPPALVLKIDSEELPFAGW